MVATMKIERGKNPSMSERQDDNNSTKADDGHSWQVYDSKFGGSTEYRKCELCPALQSRRRKREEWSPPFPSCGEMRKRVASSKPPLRRDAAAHVAATRAAVRQRMEQGVRLGRAPKFSDAIMAQLKELAEDGVPASVIAEAAGVTVSSINKWKKKWRMENQHDR